MSTKEANQQLNEENISVTSKKETVCIIGILLLFVFCSLFFQDFSCKKLIKTFIICLFILAHVYSVIFNKIKGFLKNIVL